MNTKNVKPTFGISFGLPQQGGGGYPINPHGPNPLVNPYGGSVGSSGINLGLVSVNPLISVQLEKDDYGRKVIKPFVNLHVTPNDYLVHKLEDLLAYKKEVVFNKHQHYHSHYGPHKFHRKPHYFHGPKPHFVASKPPPPLIYDDESAHPATYYGPPIGTDYYDDPLNYGGGSDYLGRAANFTDPYLTEESNYDHQISRRGKSYPGTSNPVRFPSSRKRRDLTKITNDPMKVRGRPNNSTTAKFRL